MLLLVHPRRFDPREEEAELGRVRAAVGRVPGEPHQDGHKRLSTPGHLPNDGLLHQSGILIEFCREFHSRFNHNFGLSDIVTILEGGKFV